MISGQNSHCGIIEYQYVSFQTLTLIRIGTSIQTLHGTGNQEIHSFSSDFNNIQLCDMLFNHCQMLYCQMYFILQVDSDKILYWILKYSNVLCKFVFVIVISEDFPVYEALLCCPIWCNVSYTRNGCYPTRTCMLNVTTF